jgi:hypothetical protein
MIKALVTNLTKKVPVVRSLVEERDAALIERDTALSERAAASTEGELWGALDIVPLRLKQGGLLSS